jgi:tRNA(Ile)-lysidine synthase
MLDMVKKTIAENGLIKNGQKVVAGVSGGADSVALLHCLLTLSRTDGFDVYAAHLHHGIRGESADSDLAFVRDLCEQWGIPLYTERLNVPSLAAKDKKTLEQAGREARYAFLERARIHFGADRIAVAHHMDDQAESILLHMIRGSALNGLTGMSLKRERIIRPLLNLRRSNIESYLENEGIAFCIDETNLVASGARNRLRLDVIPYIEQNLNPSVVPTLCSMAELLRRDENYLTELARCALDRARRGEAYLRSELACLELPVKTRALKLALFDRGISEDIERVHMESLCELLKAKTGTQAVLPGITAWTSYDLLYLGDLEPAKGFREPLLIPGKTETPSGEFLSAFVPGNNFIRDKNTAYMDADILKGLEPIVRSRLPGDRFYPLGAPGRKKLKEFFIDKKVPRNKRDLPMICEGSDVLFIPGYGISEAVKVTDGTKRTLRVAFKGL